MSRWLDALLIPLMLLVAVLSSPFVGAWLWWQWRKQRREV